MKCITEAESSTWLASRSVDLEGGGKEQSPRKMNKMMCMVPKNPLMLTQFSCSLADWWPDTDQKMIEISYWNTYPPDQCVLFHTIRKGCGESRTIIDAPGHIFDGSSGEEKSLFSGVLFLIIAYNWQALVTSETGNDLIYLGDEYIQFSSGNILKLEEAFKLVADYKLKVIKDVREAWGQA